MTASRIWWIWLFGFLASTSPHCSTTGGGKQSTDKAGDTAEPGGHPDPGPETIPRGIIHFKKDIVWPDSVAASDPSWPYRQCRVPTQEDVDGARTELGEMLQWLTTNGPPLTLSKTYNLATRWLNQWIFVGEAVRALECEFAIATHADGREARWLDLIGMSSHGPSLLQLLLDVRDKWGSANLTQSIDVGLPLMRSLLRAESFQKLDLSKAGKAHAELDGTAAPIAVSAEPDLAYLGGWGARVLSVWQMIYARIDYVQRRDGDDSGVDLAEWLDEMKKRQVFFDDSAAAANSDRLDRMADFLRFRSERKKNPTAKLWKCSESPDNPCTRADVSPHLEDALEPVAGEILPAALAWARHAFAKELLNSDWDASKRFERALSSSALPQIQDGQFWSPAPFKDAFRAPPSAGGLRWRALDPGSAAVERLTRASYELAKARQYYVETALPTPAKRSNHIKKLKEHSDASISTLTLVPYPVTEAVLTVEELQPLALALGRRLTEARALKDALERLEADGTQTSLLELSGPLLAHDLVEMPRKTFSAYKEQLKEALAKLRLGLESSWTSQDLALAVCDRAVDYRIRMQEVAIQQSVAEITEKAEEVYKLLEEAAALEEQQAQLEAEAAELTQDAEEIRAGTSAKQVALARDALALQQARLKNFQAVAEKAKETIGVAQDQFRQMAKQLRGDAKDCVAEAQRAEAFKIFSAVVDVVAAVAAPFTGGLSLTIAAGVKVGVTLAEKAMSKQGLNIKDVVGAATQAAGMLAPGTFPTEAQEFLKTANDFLTNPHKAISDVVRTQLGKDGASYLALASAGANATNGSFEPIKIDERLKAAFGMLLDAGAAYRSPAFDDLRDRITPAGLKKSITEDFGLLVSSEGKAGFESALTAIDNALQGEAASLLLEQLSGPVVVVKSANGEPQMLTRNTLTDLDNARIADESTRALKDLSTKIQGFADGWSTRITTARQSKDCGALNELEREIKKAISDGGELWTAMDDLNTKLKDVENEVKKKKEDLELVLAGHEAAKKTLEASKRRAESTALGIKSRGVRKRAASLQLEIAKELTSIEKRRLDLASDYMKVLSVDLDTAVQTLRDRSGIDSPDIEEFVEHVASLLSPRDSSNDLADEKSACVAKARELTNNPADMTSASDAVLGMLKWVLLVSPSSYREVFPKAGLAPEDWNELSNDWTKLASIAGRPRNLTARINDIEGLLHNLDGSYKLAGESQKVKHRAVLAEAVSAHNASPGKLVYVVTRNSVSFDLQLTVPFYDRASNGLAGAFGITKGMDGHWSPNFANIFLDKRKDAGASCPKTPPNPYKLQVTDDRTGVTVALEATQLHGTDLPPIPKGWWPESTTKYFGAAEGTWTFRAELYHDGSDYNFWDCYEVRVRTLLGEVRRPN